MFYPNRLHLMFSWLLLVLGCLHASSADQLKLRVGDAFPPLDSYSWEGATPQGISGKVVLVDFWASWCSPCKESFPALATLSKEYSQQGLVIIGINMDEERSAMEKFLKKHPVDFTIVREKEFKLARMLAIQAMPTSILIGKDGRVRMIHQGYEGKVTLKKLKEEINKCL